MLATSREQIWEVSWLMMTMKGYLSTAINRKAWEEKTATPSEKPRNAISIVGPEDLVSIVAMFFSIVVFFIVILYGELDGKYTFLKHIQFLSPVFLLFVFAISKIRRFEQGRPMREINGFRILQCSCIWLNGGMVVIYLVSAFA